MRILPVVLCIALATGCKKKNEAVALDAAVATNATASVTASAITTPGRKGPPAMPLDAGTPDAAGLAEPPTLPLASDKLELVAVAKGWNAKVIWLKAFGERVWLSGRNVDAYADGDGPLVKGPDLLAKLDYKPGVHGMQVAGAWPNLYLLRYKRVEGRMESPEATAFVYHPDGSAGTWSKAQKLPFDDLPWGFVGLKDSALLVYSQNAGNAGPSYAPPDSGTTVHRVAPDGSVERAKLEMPHRFMAWSASADDGVLSLLGTTAEVKPGDDYAGGVDLVRITAAGSKTIRIQRELAPIGTGNYGSHVHEHAGTTIVTPVDFPEDGAWKPNNMASFVLRDDKPVARTTSGGDSCNIKDAMVVGESIWSIRRCYVSADLHSLVRLGPDGKTERIAIPRLVKSGTGFRAATTKAEQAQGFACSPDAIFVRGKSDVWVRATCGESLPAIYRLGRPQEPIVLP